MIDRILRSLGLARPLRPITPEPRVFCVGRDDLCEDVVRSTLSHGCALLFGGRQSGKTTALRNIASHLIQRNAKDVTGQAMVPVLVDLMRLPYDATPGNVFATLATLTIDACAKEFPATSSEKKFASRVTGLDSFETAVVRVRSRVPHVDLRFVYLLDESKRVIGDRFPRGFHDNLFHVLFGDSGIRGVCNIVFAGAQELYHLCEDDTSPIGSRAAKHCLMNLAPEAIYKMATELLGHVHQDRAKELSDQVYELTGGHAGLSAGLLRAIDVQTALDTGAIQHVVARFRIERSELFQVWVNSLTTEARPVHDALIDKGCLAVAEIVELLRRNSLAAHRCDRVADELQYVGVARREGEHLISCNRVYSDIARLFAKPAANTELERTVWPLIEQTEIGLRQLVRNAFAFRWGPNADAHIRQGIGEDAWSKVVENRERYAKSYPRSQQTVNSDEILNFAYLGQLGQLMMWKKAWELFKHLFRDRRELEDMLRDIVPVRNDGAHFRSVPAHELNRCRVRCIDLLTVLERNQELTSKTL